MPANPTGKIHGWNSYAPIFAELIAQVQPRKIVEVGSWKGASACHMLSLAPDAHIYCVDTWQGSVEHQVGHLPKDADGNCVLRDVFLANVRAAGFSNRVEMFVGRSVDMAPHVARMIGAADLVYIDASHEEGDVLADLRAYWPLVRPGGIMFGDDYTEFPSVRRAVNAFGVPVVSGNNWRFDKPQSGRAAL